MSSIRVINPGLLTTIQDMGRYGYGRFGIPVSGVMDTLALRLANILLGNEMTEAALEITIIGPTLEFGADTIISITGGNLTPTINSKPVDMYTSIYINRGDVLSFGMIQNGCRVYLAVAGGFNTNKIMESKSTYLRGQLGGVDGRKLLKDDIIPIESHNRYIGIRRIEDKLIPRYSNSYTARVIMGQEEDRFEEDSIRTFFDTEYTLTAQCDRMGYRLEGSEIKHKDGADIISSGITFGAIQVPGDGKPIIMMADRQTTGGYTKIGNIISIDLPYVAQLKAGDKLTFERIDITNAQRLMQKKNDEIMSLADDLNSIEIKQLTNSRAFKIKLGRNSYDITVKEIV